MSVKQNIDATTIGKRYAELVRKRNLPVQGVWVRKTPECPEIWIVTQPLALEQMRPVYEARVALREAFPSADYVFNTINPNWVTSFSVADHIPADSQRIELHE